MRRNLYIPGMKTRIFRENTDNDTPPRSETIEVIRLANSKSVARLLFFGVEPFSGVAIHSFNVEYAVHPAERDELNEGIKFNLVLRGRIDPYDSVVRIARLCADKGISIPTPPTHHPQRFIAQFGACPPVDSMHEFYSAAIDICTVCKFELRGSKPIKILYS